MKLTSFRITNYRSVNDSGAIETPRITAILGRNESGKSNLLRALASLKPPGGIQPLSKIKDFPRHRRLDECSDGTRVVESTWELDSHERTEVEALCPRASEITSVTVARTYSAVPTVVLTGLTSLKIDAPTVAATIRKTKPHLMVGAQSVPEQQAPLETAVQRWEEDSTVGQEAPTWPQRARDAASALRQAFANVGQSLPPLGEEGVAQLEELADALVRDPEAVKSIRNHVWSRVPTFMFLDEFPELSGHQNIDEFLHRKAHGQVTEGDRNFARLCKVAGLDPQELQQLLASGDHESRNQLVNRASAVVTAELRRLWKDRPLKVRFNIDAQHLDTLISDPNETYDVEVNLDERSRGFRWFFSFYIAFAADTDGGDAAGAILLLDEPGLFLHALSQADLLRHLDDDFENQIVYTTHSPFMVPTQSLERVRTANITKDAGTKVSNDPTGDAKTLFPLQSALGYSISQSLFLGGSNLVVEGVTDFWMISSVAAYIADRGGKSLDKRFTITPAGGAQKVSYMVALLTSERLKVVVLLDDESKSRETKDELLKSRMIRDDGIVFVTEAFADPAPVQADIEDLLDPNVFEELVREAYAKELKAKKLVLNPAIPRIAKQCEAALTALGIPFHKTRPARLFLQKMADRPDEIMTPATTERFERLFAQLNGRLTKLQARDADPFM